MELKHQYQDINRENIERSSRIDRVVDYFLDFICTEAEND